MPKGDRGGKLKSKKVQYDAPQSVAFSKRDPVKTAKVVRREEILKELKQSGIQIKRNKDGKISLKYTDISDELKAKIEDHFKIKLNSSEVITPTEWTGDLIKHLSQDDISLKYANDNILYGKKYTDSKHPDTIVSFKKYNDVGLVKTVLTIRQNPNKTGWIILTNTYKVKGNEARKKRYLEF